MSITDELYSWAEVESVMCVWEELLARRHYRYIDGSAFPRSKDFMGFNDYWDDYGTAQLRRDAAFIAVWVQEVWENMDDDVRSSVCFDWEFVPRMIDQLKWGPTDHMYKSDGKFPTPSVESGVAHYKLAYGY